MKGVRRPSFINKYSFFFGLIFAFAWFVVSAQAAAAASLFLSPASGSYKVGDTFNLAVLVSSSEQAMNAAGGSISFPADKLEVTSLIKSGSILSLWVQEPSFSNSAGTINFEGIVMNPGFTGVNGKIITINFKAKAGGQAILNLSSGSVLANDGAGTNILTALGGAKIDIAPVAAEPPAPGAEEPVSAPEATTPTETAGNTPAAPTVTSLTHPDQEKWYDNNNPGFEFSLPKGVTGVNVLADRKPATDPGIRSDGLFSSYTYDNVDDGVWYFHIRLRNALGWGNISHYRFQIDTEPPAPFAVEFIQDGKIVFSANDPLSGIDYYLIEYGGKAPIKVTPAEIAPDNTYILQATLLGKQQIKITAFDKAGNFTVASNEFTVKPVAAPEITDYPRKLTKGKTLNAVGKTIYFNSEVDIWLGKDNTDYQKYAVKSDAAGKFTFTKPAMGLGTYQLWAEAVDNEGQRSNPSEKVTIVVKDSIFKDWGDKLKNAAPGAVELLAVLIPLIALILLLLFMLWYSWQKFSKLRLKAAKEIRQAKRAYQKEIEKSKKDIRKRIEILESNRARRRLMDEAEEKIIKQLKRELAEEVKSAGEEVTDVE